MAYRETEKVKTRKAATRKQVLNCAIEMVAENGFSALQMSQLAINAGLATGTLYRYFPSKEFISTEVFRYATDIEVSKVAEVLEATQGNAAQRIYNALSVFAERALRAPTMAWALIAEPVEPAVDEARLTYRRRYAALFAAVIEEGIADGSFPKQPATLMSTALVGAIAEALIGPLAPANHNGATLNPIPSILGFCLQALSAQPLHALELSPMVILKGDNHE